jgi:hypothetical protein
VGGLNAHAYKRRGYFGEYLFDTPSSVYLQVEDENGNPLPSATVELFQRSGEDIDNTPEHSGVADGQGRLHLDNKPVTSFTTETGHTLRDNIFGRIHHEGWNGTMFVRATGAGGGSAHSGWLFLTDLNIAYWSGYTGTVECTLKLQPPKTPPARTCSNPFPGGDTETPGRDQFVCHPYNPNP